jgi:hypothetical protein
VDEREIVRFRKIALLQSLKLVRTLTRAACCAGGKAKGQRPQGARPGTARNEGIWIVSFTTISAT